MDFSLMTPTLGTMLLTGVDFTLFIYNAIARKTWKERL